MVTRTKDRSRWPTRRILRHLEVSPATYYRWPKESRRGGTATARASVTSVYEILPAERQAILDYARNHPEVRHRELAWKMVDDNTAAVSASTVYRVLSEADLVCRWCGIFAIEDANGGSAGRECLRRGKSDSIGAAGDDGELVLDAELEGHMGYSTTGTSLESMMRWSDVTRRRP